MLNLWWQYIRAAQLGWDSNVVVATRLMRLAVGGALAQREAQRMIAEKVTALAEAQTAAVAKMITGHGMAAATKSASAVYRRKGAGKPTSPRPTLITGPSDQRTRSSLLIAKFLMPGKRTVRVHPHNTARCRGRFRRHISWPGHSGGIGQRLIGAVVAAVIVLVIWGFIARSRSSV